MPASSWAASAGSLSSWMALAKRLCAKVITPCGLESPRKNTWGFPSVLWIYFTAPRTTIYSFSSLQIDRDAFLCYHFHHRVLLLDVRGHLVCYAHLRLAHIFQSPGYYTPTSVWKDVLLPPGHMVHPVYSHSGYTGHCTGKAAYSHCFFLVFFLGHLWCSTGCYSSHNLCRTSYRLMETLLVESALWATKTTDIALGLFWLQLAWYSLLVAISL